MHTECPCGHCKKNKTKPSGYNKVPAEQKKGQTMKKTINLIEKRTVKDFDDFNTDLSIWEVIENNTKKYLVILGDIELYHPTNDEFYPIDFELETENAGEAYDFYNDWENEVDEDDYYPDWEDYEEWVNASLGLC